MNRKPLSAEHKKKISEALKKDGASEPPKNPRARVQEVQKALGKEGVILYRKYQQSGNKINSNQNEISGLKASLKGKSKAEKEKIKEVIKAKQAEIKEERKKIKEVKEQAKALQRVKKAVQKIAKLDERRKKMEANRDKIYAKFDELIKKTKDPNKLKSLKEKYGEAEERFVNMGSKIAEQKKSLESVVQSKGEIEKTSNGLFGKLQEFNHGVVKLASGQFWREKTIYEENTNFVYLQDQFDEKEKSVIDELVEVTTPEIERVIKQAEQAQKESNWELLLALTFLISGAVKNLVKNWLKNVYEAGKMSGASSTSTTTPPTPRSTIQLINFDATEIAEIYTDELEAVARNFTRDIIAIGGVSTAVFLSELKTRLAKKASTIAINISGAKTGEYINKGRQEVFRQLSENIIAYQRSEILDGRTCNFCLSVDGRVLKASDPLANLDAVHSHCRGVNVPIFRGATLPSQTGYPKSISDNLDLVDGKPLINNFKQLKKPINKSNESVQQEIQRRLEGNK
jgi:hypothetical protein